MGKLIGKTIAITVAGFIGLLAITFGVMALACPNVIANFFSSMGSYPASVYFMEKEYGKTGDYNYLAELVIKLDERGDSAKTVKYSEKFIKENLTEFDKYCKGVGKDKFYTYENAYEYFYEKYAVAEACTKDIDTAINLAETCVKKVGYTDSNPFRTFIYELSSGLNVTQLTEIRAKLYSLEISAIPSITAPQKITINSDITELNKIINEKQGV